MKKKSTPSRREFLTKPEIAMATRALAPAPPELPGALVGEFMRFQNYPAKRSAVKEPYYVARQEPPDARSDYWRTYIHGPFIDTIHLGDTQQCGPTTVKLLNLAYSAGTRNPESPCAETPVQRKTEAGEV
jgi:hypothetical protein